MANTKHTPGPWKLGELSETLGYDCMTAGVRAGPAVLDASDYGQRACYPLAPEVAERMMADARLIASAPELLEALIIVERFMIGLEDDEIQEGIDANLALIRAAIDKATGEQA